MSSGIYFLFWQLSESRFTGFTDFQDWMSSLTETGKLSDTTFLQILLILCIEIRYNFITTEDNEQLHFRDTPKLKRRSYLKTTYLQKGKNDGR